MAAKIKTEKDDDLGEGLIGYVKQDNLQQLTKCLQLGVDINYQDSHGRTPMHHAVLDSRLDIVSELLQRGAEPNVADQDGKTPWYHAFSLSRWDKVETNDRNMHVIDNDGRTPMHQVVLDSSLDIVSELLQEEAEPDVADQDGRMQLHLAVEEANIDKVTYLLRKKANPNAVDKKGQTPLHYAVRLNNMTTDFSKTRGGTSLNDAVASLEIFSELLRKGADPNVTDNCGQTPFYHAIAYSRWHIVSVLTDTIHDTVPELDSYSRLAILELLQRRADLNVTDNDGRTQLHHTVAEGNIYKVMKLLDGRADRNAVDKNGETPLHYAVRFRYMKTDSRITDLNIKNNKMKTPVPLIVTHARKDILTELLLTNTDPNMVDKNGQTPLHYVIRFGSGKADFRSLSTLDKLNIRQTMENLNQVTDTGENMIKEFLLIGADPNVGDKKGKTPLHFAVKLGFKYTIYELIKGGASLNIGDYKERKPIHYAIQNNRQNSAIQLLLYGADPNVVDKNDETPPYYAVRFRQRAGDKKVKKLVRQLIVRLIETGADLNLVDKHGRTAFDIANEHHKRILKTNIWKDPVYKELRELGLGDATDVRELFHENFQRCFWNRIYLVGPYSVGKSCLAKILVGETLSVRRQSTDGIWIYMGRAGMDIDNMEWVIFPKGNAITEILTNMLVSMSTLDKNDDSVRSDNKMPTTKQRLTVHDDREDSTSPHDGYEAIKPTNKKVYVKSMHTKLDKHENTAIQSVDTLNMSCVDNTRKDELSSCVSSEKTISTTEHTFTDLHDDQNDPTSPKYVTADTKPRNKNRFVPATYKKYD